jgi:acyl carrier protein
MSRGLAGDMWDEKFEGLVRQHLPFLPSDDLLDEDLNLPDFGLDSMGTVELLAKLERTYGVRFVDDSLKMENFATPRLLWTTLEQVR